MHPANHFYGHAHIMADYAGLGQPFTMLGYLQHGWNLHDGFAVGTHFTPGVGLFVWTDSVMRRGWALGRRNYHPMGAAWCYLLELEPEPEPRPRHGTIFYPFHGWEGQEVVGDHARMLTRLREVEAGPLTVCLYWNEFENEAVRRVYEDGGCRVISHGERGYAYRGTDPQFLRRQLSELRSHQRVVSNRLSSAILYGASVGCEVGVYGDPMLLSGEHPAYGGIERMRRLWPELHQERVPQALAESFATEELGSRYLRGPDELRDLFGWPPRRRHG